MDKIIILSIILIQLIAVNYLYFKTKYLDKKIEVLTNKFGDYINKMMEIAKNNKDIIEENKKLITIIDILFNKNDSNDDNSNNE